MESIIAKNSDVRIDISYKEWDISRTTTIRELWEFFEDERYHWRMDFFLLLLEKKCANTYYATFKIKDYEEIKN
ncbi:MAG: hypothetical protein ACOCWC_04930 [Bacteroidota bacterium]